MASKKNGKPAARKAAPRRAPAKQAPTKAAPKKPAAKAPVKKTVKVSELKSSEATSRNKRLIVRADDVYATKTKIAVQNVKPIPNNGKDFRNGSRYVVKTQYMPKTPANVRAAEQVHGPLRKRGK